MKLFRNKYFIIFIFGIAIIAAIFWLAAYFINANKTTAPAKKIIGQLKQWQWITGDTHTHNNYCMRTITADDIVKSMTQNNVQVASFLLWSGGLTKESERALLTGKDSPASTAEHILHVDVEISQVAAAPMGHLILLGLPSLDFLKSPNSVKN